MKAKFYLLNMLLALIACTTFTSCDWWDEDYDQSKALSGQWFGDFGMNYAYGYRDRYGNYKEIVFDSYDTKLNFEPKYYGATYGYGTQVDWYSEGPYEYQYYRFNWKVVDGEIVLTYIEDPSLNTTIYDYHMTNDYFDGYFGSSHVKFHLKKIVDYYDWTPYVNTYGYRDRIGWSYPYYAKTRAANDSIAMPDSIDMSQITDGKIVRVGNRMRK